MKNISEKYLLFSIVIFAICLCTLCVSSYELASNKVIGKITYVPSEKFGSTSITHMGEAVEKWNISAGSTLIEISSSTHASSGYPSDDSKNYIYKEDAGTSYVAQCWRQYNTTTGEVLETDININVYYSLANSAQSGCYDLYSIFLHETGHTMGLKDLYDKSDADAVMYGYVSTNTTKRDLTDDDEAGIKAIYG